MEEEAESETGEKGGGGGIWDRVGTRLGHSSIQKFKGQSLVSTLLLSADWNTTTPL